MKGRKSLRATEEKRLRDKQRKETRKSPPKQKVAAIMGRAYTIDELQKLMFALASDEAEVSFSAVAEFAENRASISQATASTPEVTETALVEQVVGIVLKNQEAILRKFESEGRIKAISYLAKSSSFPPALNKAASIILDRISPAQAKPKEPETKAEAYTPAKVEGLVRQLEAPRRETRIEAAVAFVKDYEKVTPTISEMPLLTVTSVTEKAVKVIKENADKVIGLMESRDMAKELRFLANLSPVPLPIRQKAEAAAIKVEARLPEAAPKGAPKMAPLPAEEAAAKGKEYSVWEIKAMMHGLELPSVKAVLAAIRFLKDYEAISKKVSEMPLLTVTEVTQKAVKVIEANRDAVIGELRKMKETKALSFLAGSSKFSPQTNKEAAKVLELIQQSKEEEKEEAAEGLLPPFEEEQK